MNRILGKLIVEPASDRYDSTTGPSELRGQYKTAGDMPIKLREHVYFIRCPTILAVVEAFEECGYQYAGGNPDNILMRKEKKSGRKSFF